MKNFESKKLTVSEARQVQGEVGTSTCWQGSGHVTTIIQSSWNSSYGTYPSWCDFAIDYCNGKKRANGKLVWTQVITYWYGGGRAQCQFDNGSTSGGGDDWDCTGSLIWC